MGQRLYHVCDDEHNLVEIAVAELVFFRGDRQSEGAMKTNGEVPRPVRPVRNLGHK